MLIAAKVWKEKLGLAIRFAVGIIASSWKFYSTLLLSFIHCDIKDFPGILCFMKLRQQISSST